MQMLPSMEKILKKLTSFAILVQPLQETDHVKWTPVLDYPFLHQRWYGYILYGTANK